MEFVSKHGDVVFVNHEGREYRLPKISGDGRRTIYELDTPLGTLQYFVIHESNLPLGAHFHKWKTEVFTVTLGAGFVLLCDVELDGTQGSNEIEVVGLTLDSVVGVGEYRAHTFYLKPGSEMACVSSQPFDPTDMCKAPWLVAEAA